MARKVPLFSNLAALPQRLILLYWFARYLYRLTHLAGIVLAFRVFVTGVREVTEAAAMPARLFWVTIHKFCIQSPAYGLSTIIVQLCLCYNYPIPYTGTNPVKKGKSGNV